MHIHRIPNRNSRPTYLLRATYREGDKIKKQTLANISCLSDEQIESMRLVLKGRKVVELDSAFKIIESRQHGNVQAVFDTMKQLNFENLISSRPCIERARVVAMIMARILAPDSKLSTTRWWPTTTLSELLKIDDTDDEDDLYDALDWLDDHQQRIENKLAARHLENGGMILYDLSSTWYEGKTCPLAAYGHSRDNKKGKLQVNFGLLTDHRGCPVSISVFSGNTADPKTLPSQVKKIREQFGINEMILVGDRGMLTQKQIDTFKDEEGIDWISALRSESIQKLMKQGALQLDFFDERDLFSLTHPDFPGERLIACRNPNMAERRSRKRKKLLDATEKELSKVQNMVENGRLHGKDKIGVRTGKVVNKYKVAKHFDLEISDDSFNWKIDTEKVESEKALDGIYIIRTSVPEQKLGEEETVRKYKSLSQVERAFRSLKTVDLEIRPIYHRLEKRVRAHMFLCMLAYYIIVILRSNELCFK